MTTETDKLVEMARAAGFYDLTNQEYQPTPEQLAAFRAAILADLAADVEPVARMDRHSVPRPLLPSEDAKNPLYSASTVAALKARVAELEKDAARYRWLRLYSIGIRPWGYSQRVASGLDKEIDAALTKGQP